MIFSREKLNAEYNICPTLENRRTQGGKDIPAKSRLPSPLGMHDHDTRDRQFAVHAARECTRIHFPRDLCQRLVSRNVTREL